MRLERSREWWLTRARGEGADAISAGMLAFDPEPGERAARGADEARIAFGRFVNLMRRRRGLSLEEFAEEANLDASELLVIEESSYNVLEPRTVLRLAQTFDVPERSLMELAGLVVANDTDIRQEAVRFVERSESVRKLEPEESVALEVFVRVLSQQEASRVK